MAETGIEKKLREGPVWNIKKLGKRVETKTIVKRGSRASSKRWIYLLNKFKDLSLEPPARAGIIYQIGLR